MTSYLLVALGGGIGASARFGLGQAFSRSDFPLGTLCANVLGGLLMGLLAGWLAGRTDSESLRLFIGVGLLGGFTTFSAFSLEIVAMMERGAWSAAFAYVLASVVLSLSACFAGLAVMRGIA